MFNDLLDNEKNIKNYIQEFNVSEEEAKKAYGEWRRWYIMEGYKGQIISLNRKKPRRRVINTQTGIIYENASDAARKTDSIAQSISRYCNGKVKKYKDIWKYIEEKKMKRIKIQVEENISKIIDIEIEVPKNTSEQSIDKLCDELEKFHSIIEVIKFLEINNKKISKIENSQETGSISIEEFEEVEECK